MVYKLLVTDVANDSYFFTDFVKGGLAALNRPLIK